jgi:anti-sigma B factor antagonist
MSSAPRPAESSEPAVSTERKGSAVIAKVRVKLLDDNSLRLLSQLIDQSAGTEGVSTVIVDLSKVELLPSLGLGMLLQMSTKCKTRQQSLKLACVQPKVRQVFTITKLDRVFDLSDTVEAAMQ